MSELRETRTHARERHATKLAHRLQLSGFCGRDDLTGIEALPSSMETAAGQHSGNTSVRKPQSYLFQNSYEGIRGFPHTASIQKFASSPSVADMCEPTNLIMHQAEERHASRWLLPAAYVRRVA
jgi:hypothetical protein